MAEETQAEEVIDKTKRQARSLRHYLKHRDAIRARRRAAYAANPEKQKENAKRYREQHPDKIREMTKIYLEKNRELLYEKNRRWRTDNPQLAKDVQRPWRETHKSEISANGLRWRTENQERYRENIRRWQAANRGVVLSYSRNRKAAKSQRQPTWADTTAIKMIYTAAAMAKITWPDRKIHVDHEIPLRGRRVSGLHVHNNLRVVLARDNLCKANKFEP